MLNMAKLILGAILLLSLFLRSVDINSNPKGMYGDELTLVYDAYSILHTGYDQKGVFLPLVFQQGGGRPGGYVYATVPVVALLGPTALAVRFWSIVAGVGLVGIIFLLVRKLFNEKVGLIAALFWAISPWDLALSRGGFESHLALFLSVGAYYVFLKAQENKWWYLLSGFCFGYAIQTYPTYRLLIPAFVPILLIIQTWINKNWWKKSKIAVIIFLILVYSSALLGLAMTFRSDQPDRFSTINIFSQSDLKESIKQKINLERSIDQIPVFDSLIHNKAVEYAGILGDNYLKNFNPNFLFLHGDGTPRHNPGLMGEMYLIDSILVILGIIFLFKTNQKILSLLISWLVLAPVPAALVGDPHALRDTFMLPSLIILSSLGADYLWNLTVARKLQLLRYILILLLIFQFFILIDRVYFLSPNEYSNYWGYSSKVASELVIKNLNQFDYIFISTQIPTAEFAYPVFAQVDPKEVIDQNRNMTLFQGYFFRRYGKVYIGDIPTPNIDKFVDSIPGNVLYLGPASQGQSINSHYEISGTNQLLLLTIKTKPFTKITQ